MKLNIKELCLGISFVLIKFFKLDMAYKYIPTKRCL
jgi:hypothetical protein